MFAVIDRTSHSKGLFGFAFSSPTGTYRTPLTGTNGTIFRYRLDSKHSSTPDQIVPDIRGNDTIIGAFSQFANWNI